MKIAEDVSAFIEKGGKIEEIESGRSGVNLKKPADKNIKIGNGKPA